MSPRRALLGLALATRPESADKNRYADEHPLDLQRYHGIRCLAYGSDPEHNQHIIEEGELPRQREAECVSNFKRVRKTRKNLLRPHIQPGAVW